MGRIFKLFEMSEIIDYHLDVLNNEFVLEVNNHLFGKQLAVFQNVSTFYFIHDVSESRKNIMKPDKCKDLETSDIGIIDEAINIELDSKSVDWIKNYSGGGNIFIEIWDQLVILESSNVIINGINHELKNVF